jgi:hypothetical protein
MTSKTSEKKTTSTKITKTKMAAALRTSQIEEISNTHLIHPISRVLVPHFARLKITPNMVSLCGLFSGLAASFAYFRYENIAFTILGFTLMFIWHVMDGADGQLARLTNSQSEFGKVIDGICDYVTFISVYVALALVMAQSTSDWIWIIVVFAGACHAVQAGAYEVQRQEFDFWGMDKKSAELPDTEALKNSVKALKGTAKLLNTINMGYSSMQYKASGIDLEFRKKMYKALDTDAKTQKKIRRNYIKHFAPSVKAWGFMNANYRTFAIFIACVIKQPILYFILEITLLNLILIILVKKQKEENTSFLSTLKMPKSPLKVKKAKNKKTTDI